MQGKFCHCMLCWNTKSTQAVHAGVMLCLTLYLCQCQRLDSTAFLFSKCIAQSACQGAGWQPCSKVPEKQVFVSVKNALPSTCSSMLLLPCMVTIWLQLLLMQTMPSSGTFCGCITVSLVPIMHMPRPRRQVTMLLPADKSVHMLRKR